MSSAGKGLDLGKGLELEWWPPGTIPSPASIVWCKFPDHLAPGVPGPKERPALVFKVRYADDPPADRFYVQVAYGTSKMKHERRLNDFALANVTLLNLLRLPQPTRFDLDNVLWLPWAKPFFCPRDETDRFATPTISTLPDDLQRVLGWTMAEREAQGLNDHFRAPVPKAPPEGAS
jgi:hypothetical protein